MAHLRYLYELIKTSRYSYSISRHSSINGFTLLEILVAVVIFSILSTLAYSSLITILDTNAALNRQAEQLAALQIAILTVGRDIEQFIARPIRDEFGDSQPPLRGSASQVEFTRAGWLNSVAGKQSGLLRVGYQSEEGILYRFSWTVLDRAQDSQPQREFLLNKVTTFALRYLDRQSQWHERWPPLTVSPNELPLLKAIEVSVQVENMGNINRLFGVKGSFGSFQSSQK